MRGIEFRRGVTVLGLTALCQWLAACAPPPEPTRPVVDAAPETDPPARRWLAGDHHVHSQYSVTWNREVEPPEPMLRTHGTYPIQLNAAMGEHFGLSWMVSTDHGGREHAKLNLEQAYPNHLLSREVVPGLIQFFGLELNAPGADHVSVILPHTHDEAERVYELESRFDRALGPGRTREEYAAANAEPRMLEALGYMQGLAETPLVIANHPARTARPGQRYGSTTPAELRAWNDMAPEIAVGMAGAPGHQAATLAAERAPRGQYGSRPTRGGFDPMTAELGGFWDSMLGEGRRWWITANSDSHRHWTEGGVDFWPGEYSKTYVFAEKRYEDILSALREGRIFVTTGDLITELSVSVASGAEAAGIGESLATGPGTDLLVSIRVRDPAQENANGDTHSVRRVDLIAGNVDGRLIDAAVDSNPSTRVLRRFDAGDWSREGEYLTMTHTVEAVDRPLYLRVRGTNTGELEPEPDTRAEDPWDDLWFYSNPVFVRVE